MSKNNILSKKIVLYIKQNNISVTQISDDTGILVKKLVNENSIFNAVEFLELCHYLGVDPRDL